MPFIDANGTVGQLCDQVRVVGSHTSTGNEYIGAVGRVISISWPDSEPRVQVRIDFDSVTDDDNEGWESWPPSDWFYSDTLEVIGGNNLNYGRVVSKTCRRCGATSTGGVYCPNGCGKI